MKKVGNARASLLRFTAVSLWLGLGLFWLSGFAVAQAKELPEKVVLDKFPIFAQWYNLSCEYSATRMITAYWGKEINDTEFINLIPVNLNPHLGYRGNINGSFGGTWDYGIYAEPIARALEQRGFKTKLIASGPEGLKQELALGRPVQVWAIVGMGWGSTYTETVEGLSFKLAAGEHSMVIYGYDSQGVYVADPGFGTRDYYSWDSFLRSWGYFDYMAMSVWPANSPATGEESLGISPYFYRYWLNTGGVSIFGYPISGVMQDGVKAIQYFERARFEYTLNRPPIQQIALGLLGRELTATRENQLPFQPGLPPSNPDILYFEETGHSIVGDFRAFWEKNNGLALFGYPISAEFSENGKTVQYFERARFELDPNAPPDYRVLLGRLGAEQFGLLNKFWIFGTNKLS
jgi:uncharacterized protein YvpB